MGSVAMKEEGGRLFCVDVKAREGVIESVKITGEFFANPEGLIDLMEMALQGVRLEPQPVMQAIAGALMVLKGSLIGIRASNLVTAIVRAGSLPDERRETSFLSKE
jgi:hypothetical protein